MAEEVINSNQKSFNLKFSGNVPNSSYGGYWGNGRLNSSLIGIKGSNAYSTKISSKNVASMYYAFQNINEQLTNMDTETSKVIFNGITEESIRNAKDFNINKTYKEGITTFAITADSPSGYYAALRSISKDFNNDISNLNNYINSPVGIDFINSPVGKNWMIEQGLRMVTNPITGKSEIIINNPSLLNINNAINIYDEESSKQQEESSKQQEENTSETGQSVESSPTNEVETAQESPETKSIKNVEFQPNPFFKSELQKEKIDSDRKIIDSDKEYYTSDYYKTGEMNYIKKVSLNVAPISKLNVANGISEPEWEARAGYVLGDSSGFLYKIFHNDWGIVFPYTPKVDFEHKVNYERTEIIHSNLAVSHYKNTPPPTITLQADFTADGEDNARYMYGVIHFLRSISKCEFGESLFSNDERKDYAGIPPPVLYLNGYGNYMINVPVVVTSFGINFEKNKHYVHLNPENVWMPTDITISINLEIQFNLDKYKKQFDLNEYKKNTLGYNDIKNNKINTLTTIKYQSFEEIYGQEVTTYSDNSTSNRISKGWTTFDREKTVRLNGSGWTW